EHVDPEPEVGRIVEPESPDAAVRTELRQGLVQAEEIERAHPRPTQEHGRGGRGLAPPPEPALGRPETRLTAAAPLGEAGLARGALDLRLRQAQRDAHSMTFFSIGSTVTPRSRNQATAVSISSCTPSSSRAMMPISSLTLALRTLKTRSNFLLIW